MLKVNKSKEKTELNQTELTCGDKVRVTVLHIVNVTLMANENYTENE